MNLSRHFTLAELTFSRTAAAERIDNAPDEPARANLEALCQAVLDPLRDDAGGPVKVNSGYRGPVLNQRVGGERTSQHLVGQAADIQPTTMTVLDLFKRVISLALPFDQLIYEARSATSKWVHVSHSAAGNRGQIKVAHFGPTGKVERYEPVTAEQALAIQEPATRAARRLQDLEYEEIGDEPADDGKPAAKKASKTPAKKAPGRKTTAKKAPTKKAPVKQAATKKVPAKKAPAKKASAKKAPAKKSPTKKAAPKKTGRR